MDNQAFYKISYGVFIIGVKAGDKTNACVTNTCIQVASNPTRVAISVLNTNYTCDLIKESGLFTVGILDKTVSFDTIKYFGMQSGHDVDKLDEVPMPLDDNGVPYMGWSCCAMLSCKVLSSEDLGSHTLFVAEVLDSKVLNDETPLTYSEYQSEIKPKPEKKVADTRKIIGWRCKICKYVYEGEKLPEEFLCPICGHSADDFEPIYEGESLK